MTQETPRGGWVQIELDEDAIGQRLDHWLAGRLEGISRSRAQAAIKDGLCRVGGRPVAASHKLRPGDMVEVAAELLATEVEPIGIVKPSAIALDIVAEEPEFLVVNKPAGLVTHPAPGHDEGTLANALVARYGPAIADVGGPARCGIVHRLDQLTTGLMVVARTPEAHEALTSDLAERKIRRRYLALTLGTFKSTTGEIDAPIGRRPNDRKLMGVVRDGRPARTSYRALLDHDGVGLVLIRLHTGRTHQIRVHFQSIGRPVLGDPVYGWTRSRFLQSVSPAMKTRLGPAWPARQMLHATALEFDRPSDAAPLAFRADPPQDMADLTRLIFQEAAKDLPALIDAALEEERRRESAEPTE